MSLKIADLPEENSAVVLKGVPLSFVDDKNLPEDLDTAKENPMNYFLRLTNGERNIFTYEEFILLNPFILAQYDAIYLLNNNLFIEQYPIEANFGDTTKKILLEHFTEPENVVDEPEAENLGSVAKLVDMFVGLKDCGDYLVGVYNDEQFLSEPKIKILNLFAPADIELDEIDSTAAQNFIDVQEETDFVDFVRKIIFSTPEKIFVRTPINSDISPIVKEQIIDKVAAGECNILYISPETLLGRSDLEQLIGNRTVGMIIIDEAHIVTTWGKQFRPDYWFLGDHIRKLRKVQREHKGHSFVIATFTATAIYHGVEDMYEDTINSLHMIEPITYLGYVKRGDIEISINRKPFEKGERAEYDLPKYTELKAAVMTSNIRRKKTLIYFPEVRLIEEAKMRLQNDNLFSGVATYHGKMNKDDKRENYEKFLSGEKPVMLATKAFGMGIDINDIEIVMHFAPTGNVCDYVQELGRAARRKDLRGEARYHYDKGDFKYIKRLHGLSAIRNYQLVAVAKKIYALWHFKRKDNLLLDAENFAYIFDKNADESNAINKVKTALLIIQKDFEARFGFSPINVRPIPLFATGFFVINPSVQKNLQRDYGNCFTEIESSLNVCRVNLQMIWEKNFRDKSFPQFKYLLYSKSDELIFNRNYPLESALCVAIDFAEDFSAIFQNLFGKFKAAINRSVKDMKYTSVDKLKAELADDKISKYRAQNICEILIASINYYRKNFNNRMYSMLAEKTLPDGSIRYLFNSAIKSYFAWVEKIFTKIVDETKDGQLYIKNAASKTAKEINTVLGILEALGVLNFNMTGGANSQLYIHINQIRNLKNIFDAGANYSNKILKSVKIRHEISVEMLTYIYESDFDNATIWNLLEDYFLGKIPDEVKASL